MKHGSPGPSTIFAMNGVRENATPDFVGYPKTLDGSLVDLDKLQIRAIEA